MSVLLHSFAACVSHELFSFHFALNRVTVVVAVGLDVDGWCRRPQLTPVSFSLFICLSQRPPVSDISVHKLVCLTKPAPLLCLIADKNTPRLQWSRWCEEMCSYSAILLNPIRFHSFPCQGSRQTCGGADAAAASLALCLLGCSTARSALTDENDFFFFSFFFTSRLHVKVLSVCVCVDRYQHLHGD